MRLLQLHDEVQRRQGFVHKSHSIAIAAAEAKQ
jgi:hypothetical protein